MALALALLAVAFALLASFDWHFDLWSVLIVVEESIELHRHHALNDVFLLHEFKLAED